MLSKDGVGPYLRIESPLFLFYEKTILCRIPTTQIVSYCGSHSTFPTALLHGLLMTTDVAVEGGLMLLRLGHMCFQSRDNRSPDIT